MVLGSFLPAFLAKIFGLLAPVHAFCKGTDIRQLSVTGGHWGFFTWEERTPPVHLHIPLVVRSHWVLTRSPAIQTAGQSTVSQRLV
jgi:hypothetical protein